MLDPKRSWLDPGFAQSDQHPVVCVDYEATPALHPVAQPQERQDLSPAERSRVSAARAGTPTARFWGDGRGDACQFANVSDIDRADAMEWDKANTEKVFPCRDGFPSTAPVGSFRPNPFGLYDMLGNAWQWADDCFHTSYRGAPKDGSAWRTGDCRFRVFRGGAWSSRPRAVRAA